MTSANEPMDRLCPYTRMVRTAELALRAPLEARPAAPRRASREQPLTLVGLRSLAEPYDHGLISAEFVERS